MENGHSLLMTLSAAIFVGGLLTIVARRFRLPVLALLLGAGFVLGPEVLGIVRPDELGDMLPVIVSLSIGLILFEGGMTLNLHEFRGAAGIIKRMLTLGAVVTWLVTALLTRLLFGFDVSICLLAGSLVIVTGPTVIAPLLKRMRLQKNLHSILTWESVLIDSVGVFIAVLCFDIVVGGEGAAAAVGFVTRVAAGLLMGYLGGELICFVLRRRLIPEEGVNVLSLSCAVMIFALTDALITEGGLLAVTVSGLVVGWRRPAEFKAIHQFKATLTDLLVGLLFILLIARLQLAQFVEFGWRGMLLVAGVMLVARPLTVLASSRGSGLSWRELVFLSWVAPRGIVAASMAALFSLALGDSIQPPRFLESFVYSTIIATVVIQGFTAVPLAVALGLQRKRPRGWMIVGAHRLGRRVGRFLRDRAQVPVLMVDTNRRAIAVAKAAGLPALLADARDPEFFENREDAQEIANLLALTDNDDLNQLISESWSPVLGRDHVFHWLSGASERRRRQGLGAGAAVWPGLAPPSFVCTELAEGEAALVEMNGLERARTEHTIPLVAFGNGVIQLAPEDSNKIESVLCLRRQSDPVLSALHSELVGKLSASNRADAFAQLVRRIEVIEIEGAPGADEILEDIMAQERDSPSDAGHGVALPHARFPELRRPLCFVGVLEGPLPPSDPAGEPIEIIYLLLTPSEKPELHGLMIGEIARLASNDELHERLADAGSGEEMTELIREYRLSTTLHKSSNANEPPDVSADKKKA